ncbi:MAG: hypothetical protein FWF88_00220 [Peptococcaceae bacterium]|nr:hypothetical protein [Peptococcaceae bacterium]
MVEGWRRLASVFAGSPACREVGVPFFMLVFVVAFVAGDVAGFVFVVAFVIRVFHCIYSFAQSYPFKSLFIE